ncbi:hypothetical protein JCM11641_002379 [Rhodosporidiobolus odoratus]
MHYSTRRYNKPSVKSTLASLSLASLASALVVTPGRERSPLPAVQGATSVRKSLNFGPTVPTASYDAQSHGSPALVSWNVNHTATLSRVYDHCDGQDDTLRCVGRSIATTFVKSAHKDAHFKLVDGYFSKHNGVFHAHFIQLVEGITVANANLNVNVDISTGKILSYSDSSFAAAQKGHAAPSSSADDWKHRVASWASETAERLEDGANQFILGGAPSHYSDNGPQGFAKRALDGKKAADPRHALLTFLSVATSSEQVANLMLGQRREFLLEQLSLEPSLDGSHDLVIDGHPEGLEPTKVSLTYVHDGEKLGLAWKYEIKTEDNHYEAYMTADSSTRPGDEEALLVVDWVRDFRPTGGELGAEAMALFGAARDQDVLPPHLQNRPVEHSSFKVEEAFAPVPSTTDKDEIKKLRKVKPSYKVFPWGTNDPSEGKRAVLRGTLVELDEEASPAGWHMVPAEYTGGKDTFYFETRGNNVLAQDNVSGGGSMSGFRANGGSNMTFDFPIHMPKAGHALEPHNYINASVTELFYTNNEIHDLYHRYGFDEESGNFQENNFERGGSGGDAVQANAQDGSGYNNANFATPPDGQRPRMRMYVWNGQQPYRDGDFEAGIVIHEYSHGLSTRLTGGPANSGCLGWGEAGGMGEGWGDFLATMIRMHSTNITDYDMGGWASGREGKGIRYYRYSRSLEENPSTYKFLDKSGYWGVHAIGEVWAEMLFELAENLIDAHGFHPTLFPPAVNGTDESGYYSERHYAETGKRVPAHGNTLAVQLVIDGMKLQPCRPSFQNARDAILSADVALTGGENECIIWKSFSKRGLGPEAKVVGSTPWGGGIRTEDYVAPKRCESKHKKDKKEKKRPAILW